MKHQHSKDPCSSVDTGRIKARERTEGNAEIALLITASKYHTWKQQRRISFTYGLVSSIVDEL
jgi:hypothetical protein